LEGVYSRLASHVDADRKEMDRDEVRRSTILIVVLLALAVLIAQSRRNFEVPGSSWVPCVTFKEIWQALK
jgi:hypothetical protein